mmetsp:Transcript_11961/g.28159  ORF Transcript_11961/g.28159 Transcript_11961/m.28159 type:complete len:339 (+) Transcript_11961:170-1186(+)
MALLSEEQAARFLRLKQLKLDDTARECPSCSFIQKGDPAAPRMLCGSCHHRFCFNHNDTHPPEMSCTDYEYSLRVQNQESEAWKNRHAVPCPVCKVPIQKNGGCDHRHADAATLPLISAGCVDPSSSMVAPTPTLGRGLDAHSCPCGVASPSHSSSPHSSSSLHLFVSSRLSLPLQRLIYALAFLKRVEWRRKGFPPKWMLAVSLVPPCLLAGALGLIAAHLLIGPACVAFLFVSNEGPEGVSRKLLTAAVMIPFFTSWTMWFHPENERRRAMRLARCHNDIQLVFTVLGFMGFSIVAPGFAILECFNDVTRHRMLQLGTEHAVWLAYKVGIVQTLDP